MKSNTPYILTPESILRYQQLFKRPKRTNEEDGDNKALENGYLTIKTCERDLLPREQDREAFKESRSLFLKHFVFGWDGVFCWEFFEKH